MSKCPECERILTNPKKCVCGWKGSDAVDGIEPYPDECMVIDCHNKTEITWVVAEHNGMMVRVSGSTVLYKSGKGYMERQGDKFDKWITRCGGCYLRELDKMGKSSLEPVEKLNPVPPHKKSTIPEYNESELLSEAERCLMV